MTIELYKGDCLQLLPQMASNSIRAIVTDPPYGLEFQDQSWDITIPVWLAEARRVAQAVLFTTAPTTLWNYPQSDWLACWYRTAAQSRNAQGGFNHWTPVLMYGKAKFIVDTFYSHGMITAIANATINHPSPKDVNMVCWMIESCSQVGDTVLDPFMGSGTTGVACVRLKRNFIGIEIDPTFFAMAQQRIQTAQDQLTLF